MSEIYSGDLAEYAVYVKNPNGDPNNPKFYYYDAMLITEHLDPNGGGALSHEISDLYGGDSTIEGDNEGYIPSGGRSARREPRERDSLRVAAFA